MPRAGSRLRAAAKVSAIALLLIAAAPNVAATAAQVTDVIVRNTEANPVISKTVGTTDVKGTVALAPGTAVRLADGSVVQLADGAKVALSDNTVRLADGGPVKLADGSTVQLAAGSVVALADGSSVTLDGPVQLAPGSVVGLADNASVTINNTEDQPLPVKVIGGAGGGAAARDAFRDDIFLQVPASEVTAYAAPVVTVPPGKELVLTSVTGVASNQTNSVGILGECPDGTSARAHGFFAGDGGFGTRQWHTEGEQSFGPGCALRPYVQHESGGATDYSRFSIFGYFVPAA